MVAMRVPGGSLRVPLKARTRAVTLYIGILQTLYRVEASMPDSDGPATNEPNVGH